MSFNYAVLGAGRQGTACAYDMIKLGEADSVLLIDQSLDAAARAAERVNGLLGTDAARAAQAEARDHRALVALLSGIDAFLSAVPYYLNLGVARAAIEAGANMCDLGGNTNIVRQELGLDREARSAGISIVPDCGQVPGMGTTLMVYALGLLDVPEEAFMWDGGLPQRPRPPFSYLATFHLAGLTNEYAEPAVYLRDGKVVSVPSLEEVEMVEFPAPIGWVEAFTSSGGLSTMPWTYEGKLRTIQNKTIRYPGHVAQLRAFRDLGLWGTDPVDVDGQHVVPRELFHAMFEPLVSFPGDLDVCAIRVLAKGQRRGQPAEVLVEMVDFADEESGFSAMERTTGWDAAIVAAMMARGQTPKGAVPVESAVPAELFVAELARRNIKVTTTIRS